MACQLQGDEFRIFHSLFHEWPYNSVEELRIEMTRGVEMSTADVETALASLHRRGYVEEFKPGRWQLSPNGHGVRRSLLGELRESVSAG